MDADRVVDWLPEEAAHLPDMGVLIEQLAARLPAEDGHTHYLTMPLRFRNEPLHAIS